MTKQETITMIANRIKAENRKHERNEGLDWAQVAASKIYSEVIEELLIPQDHITNSFYQPKIQG